MGIFVANYLKKYIMKKLFALLFVAAAFTFTSCGDASENATPEATEESGSEDAVVVEEEVVVVEEEVVEETAPEADATEETAEEAEM